MVSILLLAVLKPAVWGGVCVMTARHFHEIAHNAALLVRIMGRSMLRLLAGVVILLFGVYTLHHGASAFAHVRARQ